MSNEVKKCVVTIVISDSDDDSGTTSMGVSFNPSIHDLDDDVEVTSPAILQAMEMLELYKRENP